MADKIFSVADGLHDKLPSIQTAKAGRMLITTDRGEVYYEPEDKERIQVNPQADWQQNDETANDYVKNRPGGYKEILENTLSEVAFTGTKSTLNMTLVLGDTYIVTFDGVEYISTAKQDGSYPMFIGNTNYTWHSTITDDPFCIYQFSNSSCYINCDSGDHTVKVDKGNIVKIDKKYLDIRNTNIVNGSKTGSLRTIGSLKENTSYEIGHYAFAEGNNTTASGNSSHAEGQSTKASGNISHAEGLYTKASGNYSHAEGYLTEALGNYSHAEGSETIAGQKGFRVTACEKLTDTTGTYTLTSVIGLAKNQRYSVHLSSVKENCGKITAIDATNKKITVDGYPDIALSTSTSYTANYLTIVSSPKFGDIKVSGDYSHAEGRNTTASSNYQHVQGKYNIADSNNIYADIIGNGKNDTERSNAATVDWNGNGWFSGDVYTGSTSGTNRDEGSKKLATEIYTNTVSANAVKDSISGLNVVQITDKNNNLCPVTHDMGVKVSSKNLWQNTNTTFPTALSYNSDNQTYTLNTGTAGYTFVAHTLDTPIPAGTTVTISIMFQSGKGKSVAIGGYHSTGGRSWQGYIAVPNNVDVAGQTLTSTFTTTETVETFRIFHNIGDNIEEPFIFKVQYELGSTATAYTPCISDLTTVTVTRCGKNLIPYPYTDTTKTFNGITFTVNADGSVTVSGTATAQAYFRLQQSFSLKKGQYFFSGCPTGGAGSTYSLYLSTSDYKFYKADIGNGISINSEDDKTVSIAINIAKDTTINNLVFKPQLELGSTATTYEPYQGQTYTPVVDGTVSGVKSLYPTTTLMTDTEGIYIDCEYNVDLNSTIDNINNDIGDINTALDSIIEMQNSLIGGN